MRHSWRLSLGAIGVAALALGMILGGCGAAPTAHSGQGTAPIAPAAPTSTLMPISTFPPVTPSLDSVESPGCPPFELGPVQPQYTTVGGLSITIPELLDNTNAPEELLPNTAPSAPHQVPLTASEQQPGGFEPRPLVNPPLSSGYVFQVCNQTSAPHALTSLSIAIASFTPSSGPVAVWHICEGGPYDAATKQTTSGCGGGFGPMDWLAATLPSDNAGASASATANSQRGGGPDLPITLGPNQSLVVLVAVNGLTSQGTYALSLGISVDGSTPTSLTPSDGPFLVAPSATVWTGNACQTPTMQAQIPAASQDTYYVCPPQS